GRQCGQYRKREKPDEQQKQRNENADRANVSPNIHPRGMITSPGRWQEIAGQTAGNNDHALKPHAGVHAHGDEQHAKDVAAAPPEPEKLWRKAIAEEHAEPPVPPVWSENAVPKREPLVGIAAI